MIAFFSILLTVLTFGFIAYPLFVQRATEDSIDSDKSREQRARKKRDYSMLQELEFDYNSGILSEESYLEQEKRYRQKDEPVPKSPVKPVAATATEKKGTDVDEEIEKQVAELRRGKRQFCPQCGTRHNEGDAFCVKCGRKLS